MTGTEHPSQALRIAAVCFVADAGFGIAMLLTLAHLARTGELPMSPGFRSFSGPFEQLGRDAFVALGGLLIVVSALNLLAGIWVWQGKRRGARLGLATTPLALALGIGFALTVPAPPGAGPGRDRPQSLGESSITVGDV
jgi:hypothetical protein